MLIYNIKNKINLNNLFYSSKNNFDKNLLFLSEIFIICLTFLLSYHFYYDTWYIGIKHIFFVEFSFFLVVLNYIFFVFPYVAKHQSFKNELSFFTLSQLLIFTILFVHTKIIGASRNDQNTWITIWFVEYYCLTLIVRIIRRVPGYLHKKNNTRKEKVIIIGIHLPFMIIYRSFKKDLINIFDFIGYVATPCDLKSPLKMNNYFKCLGSYENIHSIFTKKEISQVWICTPYHANYLTSNILKKLDNYLLDIKWIPDINDFNLLNLSAEYFKDLPIIKIYQNKGFRNRKLIIAKIILDKFISVLVLLVLWPLMLAIAIGVKLTSPGPIFYKQKRQGLGEKTFNVIKFRSMYFNETNEIYPHQANRNDPRITRFGAFLRRRSLDELPQIFNVLAGSMSIVGPRPYAIQHNNYYRSFIHEYTKRHDVKPGITGWAQVNGYRGEINNMWLMKKRLQYDLDYIRNFSIFFDIKIIFLTIIRFYKQESAY